MLKMKKTFLQRNGLEHRSRYCCIDFGGGGGSAPAPDPAVGQASLESVQLGRDQFEWSKNVLAPWAMDMATKVTNQQYGISEDARQQSNTQWSSYLSLFAPVEERMVLDTFGYDYLNDEDATKLLQTMTENQKATLYDQYQSDLSRIDEAATRSQKTTTTTTTTTSGGVGGAVVGKGGQLYSTDMSLGGKGTPRPVLGGTDRPQKIGTNGIGGHLYKDPKYAEAVANGAELWGIQQPFGGGYTNVQVIYPEDSGADGEVKGSPGGGTTTTTTTTGGGTDPDQQKADAEARYQSELDRIDRQAGLLADTRDAEKAAIDAEAGRSMATVRRGYEQVADAEAREMQRMGLDPNSGRYRGIARATQLRSAADQAGAGTNTRAGMLENFRNRRAQTVNVGRNFPASTVSSQGTSLAGGNSAVANTNSTGSIISNARMSGLGGYSVGIGGLNNQYSNSLNAWNANNANNDNSGLFGMLGTAAGGLLANPGIFSSKKVKTKKKKVDHKSILAKVRGLPVEEWEYEPGMTHIPGKADTQPGVKHMGPYAEDMQETFGVGDGKTIHPADQGGIILSAIKALAQKVDNLERAS